MLIFLGYVAIYALIGLCVSILLGLLDDAKFKAEDYGVVIVIWPLLIFLLLGYLAKHFVTTIKG